MPSVNVGTHDTGMTDTNRGDAGLGMGDSDSMDRGSAIGKRAAPGLARRPADDGRCPAALAILVSASALWLAALVASPLAAASGGGDRPAVRAAALFYAATGTICHQQSARSFHIGGVRLPVCARCLGLYAGAFVGLLAACFGRRRDARRLIESVAPTRWWLVMASAAFPALVLWLAEPFGLLPVEWGNLARALTGLLLGGVAGWIVGLVVRAWSAPR